MVGEVIKDIVNDYVDYKKAQIILWRYHHNENFPIADKKTLDAILTISEYEKIQKNRRETKFRIRNSKKTA